MQGYERLGVEVQNRLEILNKKLDTLFGKLLEVEQAIERNSARSQFDNCSPAKPLLTTAEAAALSGRSPYTVRSWIRKGVLTGHRAPGTGERGRLLISRDELLGVLASESTE